MQINKTNNIQTNICQFHVTQPRDVKPNSYCYFYTYNVIFRTYFA